MSGPEQNNQQTDCGENFGAGGEREGGGVLGIQYKIHSMACLWVCGCACVFVCVCVRVSLSLCKRVNSKL